ncbi:MAG TPA: tetratricopeptide repeat protein [Tepidisphaeraceae bacterium]|nr:tetratricopeptide repeat protein [Tepidisphaeraceae bacterium]
MDRQVTSSQIWAQALAEQKAGRFAEAQALYRALLQRHPNHADILHMLGIVSMLAGQKDQGIDLIRRAIALKPAVADYHSNLSAALTSAGRLDEAIEAGRRAADLRPDLAPAWFNLGKALHGKERIQEAIAAYRRATELNPSDVAPWVFLGAALHLAGKYAEAIPVHQRVLELAPTDFAVQNSLGIAFMQTNQVDAAALAFEKAAAMNPAYTAASSNVVLALHRLGRIADAVAAGQKAIAAQPEFPELFNNLANALKDRGDAEQAMPLYRQAIAQRPTYAEAINNLGIAYHDLNRLDEAIACFRQSIAVNPAYPLAHWNLGLNLLRQGKLREGWPEYEWRFRAHEVRQPGSESGAPFWDGAPLNGRRILLHGEQGFGDMIQFVRYVPRVADAGGNVILYCHRELLTLMRSLRGVLELAETGRPPPQCDLHSPLLSLPRIFDTNLQNIPAQTPYLWPEPALVTQWKNHIGKSGFNVGLVWSGRPLHQFNARYQRSLPLSTLMASLRAIPGVTFHSLQTGEAARQVEEGIIDHSAHLTDFAQTAAAMANLDLIVTIDTAAAHLAGALNRPVWVLLPWIADWRWMMDRTDCPWYPTMRLFRQQSPGDWSVPLTQIAGALAAAASSPRPSAPPEP